MGIGSSRAAADMSGPVAEFVKKTIASDKIVIFSKSYCPYCKTAKEQFKKLNKSFTAVELEDRDDCREIQAVLGEMTGATSVPRVFIDGKFVGGGDDVKRLYNNGELQKLVE
ncbi:uncharacterized protein LOC134831089 [Culicoides brevitarsis]|uniref:uncharacterized protein LOC134831089 n=1 Tax=Culicoides brevitarsis TaxID=469753 RepID=UPI00307C8E50